MRHAIGTLCALFYRIVSLGRIRGSRFIVLGASHIRVESGGQIIIGRDVSIGRGARFVVRDRLEIGDEVFIGKNSTIIAFAPVAIGARTLIAQNVSIHSEEHGPPGDRSAYSSAPIAIGHDSWLGAGVVVLKGRSIGDRSTVGANSVVSRDIGDDVTAVGAPARVVGLNH